VATEKKWSWWRGGCSWWANLQGGFSPSAWSVTAAHQCGFRLSFSY
jgi:hypothetical protein